MVQPLLYQGKVDTCEHSLLCSHVYLCVRLCAHHVSLSCNHNHMPTLQSEAEYAAKNKRGSPVRSRTKGRRHTAIPKGINDVLNPHILQVQ